MLHFDVRRRAVAGSFVGHYLLRFVVAATLCAVFATSPTRAENWPCWRGPRGDGTSEETGIARRWSATENIAWRAELPGLGHSSPIVWDDRIFVTSADTDKQERLLLCLARDTGKVIWQKTVLVSPLEDKHTLNSFASGTPASDGERVYVTFLDRDQMYVAAYDFAGERVWETRPGPFASKHGYSSCPVVWQDLLIVNGDHDGDSYLVALDRADGHVVWKVPREHRTRSYVTPLIRQIDGQWQMILSGSKRVSSYDPRTGAPIWYIDGPTEQFVASLVYHHKLLFLTAGFPEYHVLAIRPDGKGNVTDTHIAWRDTKGAGYVPSPVGVNGYFLVVTDGGVASCFESETGKRQWMQRLGPHYSGSPVVIEGLVYFTADDGVTKIVRPGPTFEVLAENAIDEAYFSSPAVSQGMLYLRAEKHLLAIGPGKQVAERN